VEHTGQSFFSDEKMFIMEEVFKKQNMWVLTPDVSASNPAGRFATSSAHPTSVMVEADVTADGKTPLVFVEKMSKLTRITIASKFSRT
jgi:hypothetical protein